MVKGKAFEKIIEDIISVKIQGAENIAKAGVKAYLLNPTKEGAKRIINTRPTEPLLQNFIKLLLKSKNPKSTAKSLIEKLERSHNKMSKFGAKLIKENMNVYTHCHSSSVIDILRYAKKEGKKFVVYTTEVEPLLQGRMTARDLSKLGIKVIVAPDLAADNLMSKCDIFLFGCDAFTDKFLVNKLGSSTLCDLAIHHRVPRYSCGTTMKYIKSIKIEERSGMEVWNKHNKNIEVKNPAFDKVDYDLVSGVICEEGILNSREFLKVAKKKSLQFN